MNNKTKGFRLFYYFRIGYGTYLAMFIGVINVLTTTYFLAGKNIVWLQKIFPSFEIYILFCIGIGMPIVILAGWLHFKKIGTYTQEVAISQQYSPYNYKFPPGFNKEIFFPVPTIHEIKEPLFLSVFLEEENNCKAMTLEVCLVVICILQSDAYA